MFGLSEIAIILIVVILVLGAKKLPDLARSAGKSARILKSEARAMKKEQEQEEAAERRAPSPEALHGEVLPPRTTSGTTPSDTEHTPKPDFGQPRSQDRT